MNINRHNYETIFLLYVDNELTIPERNAVEKFVQDNIDLKPELQLFIDTALPPEEIKYEGKQSLFKAESMQADMQENLLFLLDNELDSSSIKILNAAIASDEIINTAWKLLKQTKLDSSEKIIFENKKLLYRHERNNVVAIRFWRMAAAASIIGFGIFFGTSFLSGNKVFVNNAGIVSAKEHAQTPVKTGKIRKGPNTGDINITSSPNDNLAHQKTTNIASPKNNIIPVEKNNVPDRLKQNDQLVKKEENKFKKQLQPVLENINKEESNPVIVSNVELKKQDDSQKLEVVNSVVTNEKENKMKSSQNNTDKQLQTEVNSYAQQASFNNATEENHNSVLFLNEEKVNRSKLSGIFRKVKRMIVRNTTIKSGNSIKIAGFEIAAR